MKHREREREIKEERHSQCVVIYSQLLSATLGEGVRTPAEKQRQTLTPHSTSDDSYLTKAEGTRELD